MDHGFLICNYSCRSERYEKIYLKLREELYGYIKDYPEVITLIGENPKTHVPIIHLKNASLGLLMTYEQALEMQGLLSKEFPEYDLRIVIIQYDDGNYIQWFTKDGIINNEDVIH